MIINHLYLDTNGEIYKSPTELKDRELMSSYDLITYGVLHSLSYDIESKFNFNFGEIICLQEGVYGRRKNKGDFGYVLIHPLKCKYSDKELGERALKTFYGLKTIFESNSESINISK
jgi:hypothetical protein